MLAVGRLCKFLNKQLDIHDDSISPINAITYFIYFCKRFRNVLCIVNVLFLMYQLGQFISKLLIFLDRCLTLRPDIRLTDGFIAL